MMEVEVLSHLKRKLEWERDAASVRLAGLRRQAQAAAELLEAFQQRQRSYATYAGAAGLAVVDVVVRDQALACIASSETRVRQLCALQSQLVRDMATELANCVLRAQRLDVLAALQTKASASVARAVRRKVDKQADFAWLERRRTGPEPAQDDAS